MYTECLTLREHITTATLTDKTIKSMKQVLLSKEYRKRLSELIKKGNIDEINKFLHNYIERKIDPIF